MSKPTNIPSKINYETALPIINDNFARLWELQNKEISNDTVLNNKAIDTENRLKILEHSMLFHTSKMVDDYGINADHDARYMPRTEMATLGILPIAFTPGSVIFIGAGPPHFEEDNANFFYNDATNQLLMGNGAVGAPSYSFGGDLDTGFYSTGAANISVAIAGALDFSITANSLNVLAGSNIDMADGTAIGITGGGRIEWDNLATDALYFRDCVVTIGNNAVTAGVELWVYENSLHTVPAIYNEQAGGGDSAWSSLLTGGAQFCWGIDNSDSDRFRLNYGATLGSNAHFVMDSNGYVGLGLALGTAVNDWLNVRGVMMPTLFNDTYEPTGFTQAGYAASTLSFVPGALGVTREFTITNNHDIYINGVKTTKPTTTLALPDATGLYWFYYNNAGTLSVSAVNTEPNFYDDAFIATVYWNTTTDDYLLCDERHGITMDWATHRYEHRTTGVRWDSGLVGAFANASFSISDGYIRDEDLNHHLVGPMTTCRVLYMNGAATWTWDNPAAIYYKLNVANLRYNNGINLADVAANHYMAVWVFGTGDTTRPIWVILGQRTDINIADARANNKYETLTLGTLPSPEMKLLYRVILRNAAPNYYIEALDMRNVSNLPASTYVATAHNSLTGLEWSVSGHNDINFNVNNVAGYSGIGTLSPASLLEIYSSAASPVLTISGLHATNYDPSISFRTDNPLTQKFIIGVDSTDDSFHIDNGVGAIGAVNNFVITSTGGLVLGTNTLSSTELQRIYRNDASTVPALLIEQALTGDAAQQFLLTGGTTFSMGIDNSQSDVFKIYPANALTTIDSTHHGFWMNPSTGDCGFGGAIGLSSTRVVDIYYNKTNATSGQTGLYIVAANAQNVAPGGDNYALQFLATTSVANGVTALGSVIGVVASAADVTTGASNGNLYAVEGITVAYNRGAGTGTLTKQYGILLWGNSGTAGAVTTYADIYILKSGTVVPGAEWCILSDHVAPSQFKGDIRIHGNGTATTYRSTWGAAEDAFIMYNGTDMIYDSAAVGSGVHKFMNDYANQDADSTISIFGGEAKDGILKLVSDQGDDTCDTWWIRSVYNATSANGTFVIQNDNAVKGTPVTLLTISTAGLVGINAVPATYQLTVGGQVSANRDADGFSYFDRAAIGSGSDIVMIGHLDVIGPNGYAISQNASGTTTLNIVTGQTMYFSINGSARVSWFSSGLWFNVQNEDYDFRYDGSTDSAFYVDASTMYAGFNISGRAGAIPSAPLDLWVSNANTTPTMIIEQGSTGDVFTKYRLNADNTDFSVGQKNAATNYFAISPAATLGTTGLTMSTGGLVGINCNATTQLQVEKDNILTTQSDAYGIALINGTDAAVDFAVQYSPPIRWRGTGLTGAASHTVDFREYVIPISAATVTGGLTWQSSINGAAYSTIMSLDSTGMLGIGVYPSYPLSVLSSSLDLMEIQSTDATASAGPILNLYRNSGSPDDNDIIGLIDFWAKDGGNTKELFAKIQVEIPTIGHGTEESVIDFMVRGSGGVPTIYNYMDKNGLRCANNGTIHCISQNAAPTSTIEGALWVDRDGSANGTLMCYSNGTWRAIKDL